MNHQNSVRAQAEIRDLIEQFHHAIRERAVARIMAFYAPEVTAFDAVAQLQFKGRDAYGAHWQACMQNCPDDGVFEAHQLQVFANEGLALAHWLARCGPSQDQAGWMRATQAWVRDAGRWQILHDHWSAPFDVETGRAMFELQPEQQSA